MIQAEYVHTNIVAADWRRLARFYEEVFGCRPVPPQRDLSGVWLEQSTGVPGARVQGLHLRLPGHGEAGPTLEIFQYNQAAPREGKAINQPGLAHLAFQVEDVAAAKAAVLAAGGGTVGEMVTTAVRGVGTITFAYVRDPEGNIIELQQWVARD
jgi:predicted enzyme related to lactoylglutathione lyase